MRFSPFIFSHESLPGWHRYLEPNIINRGLKIYSKCYSIGYTKYFLDGLTSKKFIYLKNNILDGRSVNRSDDKGSAFMETIRI